MRKKILMQIIIFFSVILFSCQVFATSIVDYIEEMKFSDDYLEYLSLSDEEKEGVMVPMMYEIPKNKALVTNPLKWAKMLKSSLASKYSLKTVIPENLVIKDQQNTNSCWTFSSIAALETNLALKDYNNGLTGSNAIVYDFSERHMEYATSKTFSDGVINKNGFNREVGGGGSKLIAIPYLTNGTGAIAESEMPFENNENQISISEIQNKNIITQVNDTVDFPSYKSTDDTTQIMQQMKEHIMNYGGIDAAIHGAAISVDSKVYNNDTGAIYCNNYISYPANHAILIVGWDDNYSVENFVESNRPKNNGAWIIKNSWGTSITLPDNTSISIGDNGFMYVSYEDANIYRQLNGIIDAQTEITYENIYQYNQYGNSNSLTLKRPKMYLASIFNKKTSGKEYLTQVSIIATETSTCKVYVNPNGTSKARDDLQQVQLKSGESETFDAGYHTIEFLNPIKITGENFVIVIEIEGTQANSISTGMEFNYADYFGDDGSIYSYYSNVSIESGKCFVADEEQMIANQWNDTSTMYTVTNGSVPNFDTTIKAFTTSNVLEEIKVTIPPTKTSYVEGQKFNPEGMEVKGFYGNDTSKVITDYTISNGSSLILGQESVTISYEGKTTTQAINVGLNVVTDIKIETEPKKTEYWAGDIFDTTGMVVKAFYKDGTTKIITDYKVKDGSTLKNGQTSVTIEYKGKEAIQKITVKANSVEKIEITKEPTKTKYVVGQNFNPEGMKVEATYANKAVKEITNYIIQDGTNLQIDKTAITIEYEGKITTQKITVEAKVLTAISVKKMPTKTVYIQYKDELDLAGGIVEISYNDGNVESIDMTSKEIEVSGFDNQKLGNQIITLKYLGKTTQFAVEIKEEPKPENSNFDNIKGDIKRIRAHYFTDIQKDGYTLITVEISDIAISKVNDNMEYYYYLSSNQKESDIKNWVKINELKEQDNKFTFEINSSDISNYEGVASSDVLYLYIKEVASRNGMITDAISPSVLLEVENVSIEEYVDGKKTANVEPDTTIDSTTGKKEDSTIANGIIPNAGKNVLLFCLILLIAVVARVAYLRYKDIQI